MSITDTREFVNQVWDESITPELIEYIKIPNKSPAFDPDWEKNGYMETAIQQFERWCEAHALPGMQLEVVRLPGRTPLLFIEVPGQIDQTVLLYGHLDKQPEMVGWDPDLGPWKPVLRDDKLYGRGGADDGYACFASLTAIAALQEHNIPHARCVIVIEACEESGSYDLPFYVDALKPRIGSPDLIICLDSGCGTYEHLWATTSLRGVICGELSIKILTEGIHSGIGSGIVPSTFSILQQLLARLEDPVTGKACLPELTVDIPEQRIDQAKAAAKELSKEIFKAYPFIDGAKPISDDPVELILNRTWRPALSVTGLAGLPALEHAGNVTVPELSVKLSYRLAPTVDPKQASALIKQALESNPPHGAKVSFSADSGGAGWHAPLVADWLHQATNEASQTYFNNDILYMGEGGSIPFMGMLGEKFPQAQFLITGVLGPKSNAHGPNEFLHLPTAKKLTACVAHVLAKHYDHHKG